jgi:hypothetical protein
VRVRRTGGIAGRFVEGTVDLDADSPRATTARELVGSIDFASVVPEASFPDAFSYTFQVGDRTVTVPQHQLTDEQRMLADLALTPSDGEA